MMRHRTTRHVSLVAVLTLALLMTAGAALALYPRLLAEGGRHRRLVDAAGGATGELKGESFDDRTLVGFLPAAGAATRVRAGRRPLVKLGGQSRPLSLRRRARSTSCSS